MSDRLKLINSEVEKLSAEEQDAFLDFMMIELQDESDWRRKFAASQDLLGRMADEALEEHRAGKTRPLEDLLN